MLAGCRAPSPRSLRKDRSIHLAHQSPQVQPSCWKDSLHGLGAGPLDAEFVQDSRRRDSGRLRWREERVAVLDDSGLGRPVELEQRVVPRRALVVQHDVHVPLAPHGLEDLAPIALEHFLR